VNLKNILARSWAYRLFAKAIGGHPARLKYARRFIRAWPGARVLDLGCGPADILDALPAVEYVGVDISPEYIRAARERHGSRGQFVCASAVDFVAEPAGSFDIVLATGLLHHLDDREAEGMLRAARAALKPDGRLVSLDGCYDPTQSWAARWMLDNDRGRHVRRLDEYLKLAATAFSQTEPYVNHRMLNIPYAHLVMVCHPAAGAGNRTPGA
jgi:SAM-dependent methyltransferase